MIATASERRVLVVGGGVAAVELLLALRARLDGARFAVTIVSRGRDLVYRPLAVAEPFHRSAGRRYRLAEISADLGATFRLGRVVAVDAERKAARLDDGREISYDALVVATGARAIAPLANAFTFFAEGEPDGYRWVLGEVERGTARSVAFVVPGDNRWTLPLYELALQTAWYASTAGVHDLVLTVVTPEDHPLAIFHGAGSEAVARLLRRAGVAVHTNAYARSYDSRRLRIVPGGRRVDADHVIALPTLRGPEIDGLPSDVDGFVRVDEHGRVVHTEDVYAIGDATDFPVKQGGLATQHADHVADLVAGVEAAGHAPRPHLRAILLTGDAPMYLTATITGGTSTTSTVSWVCPWWPPQKIAARYLAPYLADREQAPVAPAATDRR
jgi:sulfide:quinone oxidoreductase